MATVPATDTAMRLSLPVPLQVARVVHGNLYDDDGPDTRDGVRESDLWADAQRLQHARRT